MTDLQVIFRMQENGHYRAMGLTTKAQALAL